MRRLNRHVPRGTDLTNEIVKTRNAARPLGKPIPTTIALDRRRESTKRAAKITLPTLEDVRRFASEDL